MDVDSNIVEEAVTKENRLNMEKETKKKKKKDEEEKTTMVPFYKLFAFADSLDIFLMILGTIGAVANGLGFPVATMLFGDMIDAFGFTISGSDPVKKVSKVSLNFVYLGMGTLVGAFLQVSAWVISGERQAVRIRNLYLKNILRQDIAFFDVETNAGDILGRMSSDTVLIQEAMGEKVGKAIQLASTFIGGFAVAFIKGWYLTLVMLSSIPLLVIGGAALGFTVAKMAPRGQNAYTKAAIIIEQTIGSIRTVASFSGEKRAISEYKKCLISAYRAGIVEGVSTGLGLGFLFSVILCTYALGVWYGGKLIVEKGYTGGQVLNIIVAVLTGSMSLGQASPCLSAFTAGRTAAYKMFVTIERKPGIDAYDTNGKEVLDNIRGDVELRDVYFSYPARPQEQIFNGFSLFIPSGRTTALVGQSGSGKSTVISLIERFYDPQAGEILIDGINLKEFQLKWIRSKIGLVSQEPVLFSSSIKENIAYSNEGATIEEIRAAVELANVSDFIDKLPQGLETMVGENGTQLSGGEKQRIAIARAILKNPRILLLDEATSALDVESERIVQEALDRVMVNRTTVIVAHRLSTVRNSDMIAVIYHGKIVEKGSHSELLKDTEGAYSQLIRLQEDQKTSVDLADERTRLPERSIEEDNRHYLSVKDVNTDQDRVMQPANEQIKLSLLRIAALNKPEILVLVLGFVSAMGNGIIRPLFSLILAEVIKAYLNPPEKLEHDIKFWATIFVFLGIAHLVLYPIESFLFSVAGCKLVQRIRLMCFERVVHMEVEWFDEPEHSSGAIGARLSADASTIHSLVGDTMSQTVQNLSTVVGGLIVAFVACWQLAFIALIILPLLLLSAFAYMMVMNGSSANAKKMYEEASQVANDAVTSIRTVASFCAEEKVMKTYEKKCKGPLKTGIRQGIVNGVIFGISFFVLFSSIATIFYAGVRMVYDGKTTFEYVFKVFLSLFLAAVSITQSSSLNPVFKKANTAADSVFAIIDRESKIDSSNESGIVLDTVIGDIEFHHVSFSYPARPDTQIFRDLCLTIASGKTVALVGESGSGKSTVIALLQRFYDPHSGKITLDGVEIQRLKLKWLRQQMGLVSQEPVLFNDSIRANIAYGKGGDASEAEIISAAELSNAHGFISGLKQGYDTIVGERGVKLSGGQKQRVAIARAIAKEPKVLLLDEATSALDAESERVVQSALDRVMVNRTTVVVAHRLSTVKNADVIAVVKNGVIVERGNHETLINIKDGVYASLVQRHTI